MADRPESAAVHLEELFQSAKILMGEGLFEDSKKILRKILIEDFRRLEVRDMLNQILELELKNLLSSHQNTIQRKIGDQNSEEKKSVHIKDIIQRLNEDYGIGNFENNFLEPSVRFVLPPPATLNALSNRDLMDLGIAFLNLRQMESALQIFKSVTLRSDPHDDQKPVNKIVLSSHYLIATTYLSFQRPFEAIMVLEPVLRNTELDLKHKKECFYLMGKAKEQMSCLEEANLWYERVSALDATYLDVPLKLKKNRPNEK